MISPWSAAGCAFFHVPHETLVNVIDGVGSECCLLRVEGIGRADGYTKTNKKTNDSRNRAGEHHVRTTHRHTVFTHQSIHVFKIFTHTVFNHLGPTLQLLPMAAGPRAAPFAHP